MADWGSGSVMDAPGAFQGWLWRRSLKESIPAAEVTGFVCGVKKGLQMRR